jgi:hypothetical protein
MHDRTIGLVGVVALVLTTGCFQTTVYTGLPGAGERVSQPWARSFVFGLVAPPTLEPASKCSAGVYRVETSHTVANIVALVVTAGIYSPMRIDVTCVRIPKVSQVVNH